MSGNSKGAKKGARTKADSGFDFAAAGRKGGSKKGVKKGLAALSKEERRRIQKKAAEAKRQKKWLEDF